MLVREERGKEAIVMCVPPRDEASPRCDNGCYNNILAEFDRVLVDNKMMTFRVTRFDTKRWSKRRKADWWAERETLDARLTALLLELQEMWLGPWKVLLCAPQTNAKMQKRLEDLVQRASGWLFSMHGLQKQCILPNASALIRVLVEAADVLNGEELAEGFAYVLGVSVRSNSGMRDALCSIAKRVLAVHPGIDLPTALAPCKLDVMQLRQELSARNLCTKGRKAKLVTRLEKSITTDHERTKNNKQRATTSPVFQRSALLLVLSEQVQHLPWESLPCINSQDVARMPSLALILERALEMCASSLISSENNVTNAFCRINKFNGACIIDPHGDLPQTRRRLAPISAALRMHFGWNVMQGKQQHPSDFTLMLQENDIVLYCGHGSGEDFLSREQLEQMPRCAAAILMGCSSGYLKPQGQFDPTGIVPSYLLAGSPSVVANLWDVTDSDIDLFTADMLRRWLALPMLDADFTICDGSTRSNAVRLLSAVREARGACRLFTLNGAAPVFYGMPVLSRIV